MIEGKRAEFVRLFQEFAETYPATPDGQHHIDTYETSREQGRHNFEEINAAEKRGADVADQVLLKLLPYRDAPAYRQKGAWVHIAPATGDTSQNSSCLKRKLRAGFTPSTLPAPVPEL